MQPIDEARAHQAVPVRRRAYFLAVAVVMLVLHNLVHELVHLAAASVFSEPVTAFRFLTNGWGTSQVLFATPVELRSGWPWMERYA